MVDRKIYVALPVLREFENLASFFKCIEKQSYTNFECIVCVNQPESWWDTESKINTCLDNAQTLDFLRNYKEHKIHIIDKSSKGNGWCEKKKGVGMARKVLFDYAATLASENDLILSLDADTTFNEHYFASVSKTFQKHPKAMALAAPYYHPLTVDSELNRSMLRYEIYMRYYLLNLIRIESPYAFTALGSALIFPKWAYHKVGGITPVLSGEDFYFLQKLAKVGQVLLWNEEKVFPAVRKSDRVIFGTGPALQKDFDDLSETYPIYDSVSFNNIKKSHKLFPLLFEKEVEIPVSLFLEGMLKTNNIWEPLRKNHKTVQAFVNACHQRFDGLRILQYLRQHQPQTTSDEELLIAFAKNYPEYNLEQYLPSSFSFENSSIEELQYLRNALEKAELEARYRKG